MAIIKDLFSSSGIVLLMRVHEKKNFQISVLGMSNFFKSIEWFFKKILQISLINFFSMSKLLLSVQFMTDTSESLGYYDKYFWKIHFSHLFFLTIFFFYNNFLTTLKLSHSTVKLYVNIYITSVNSEMIAMKGERYKKRKNGKAP